jgi:hypothetical protein
MYGTKKNLATLINFVEKFENKKKESPSEKGIPVHSSFPWWGASST